MDNYAIFRTPQEIIYGRNAFENVGMQAALKGKKVLIVTYEVIDRLDYINACKKKA